MVLYWLFNKWVYVHVQTLYLLGHSITIATSKQQLQEATQHPGIFQDYESYTFYQFFFAAVTYDLLFTDYIGMYCLHDLKIIGIYKCKLRLLDSFGTEPICKQPLHQELLYKLIMHMV